MKAVILDCPSRADEAVRLALVCRTVHGAAEIEANLALLAAWGFREAGQVARAHHVLDALERRAPVLGVPGLDTIIEVVRADMLHEAGEQARALSVLVGLVKEQRRFRLLSPQNRSLVFYLMADTALEVDPGDSFEIAFERAKADMHDTGKPMPEVLQSGWAYKQIVRWLWADPAFAGLLQSGALPASGRAERLDSALQLLRQIESNPSNGRPVSVQSRWQRLMQLAQSLASNDTAQLRMLGSFAARSQPGIREAETNYVIAAGLLVQGQLQAALELLDASAGLPINPPVRELWFVHLRSQVLHQLGDDKEALRLYGLYARGAAAQMARMQLGMRDVLMTLSALPGGRPADRPAHRPQYLERALTHLREHLVGTTVAELAALVGVSERTLRDAFQSHLGQTPKQYILRQRLQAVHDELSRPSGSKRSVQELAERHGFGHAGRFSRLYRNVFNQAPSQTALQARQSVVPPAGA